MRGTAAQLALRWCLLHPAVTSVILGANQTEHLAGNLAALDLTISDSLLSEVDKLFALDQPDAP